VTIVAAGGLDDDTIGTNAERIHAALVEAASPDGTLMLVDLGSAVMSAQVAIEMLPEKERGRVDLSKAPLVEGAVVAAVEASIGKSLSEVRAAAESAAEFDKLA
jgi:dihydroxyacetone kinase DhaKLM complex PTS-EIIA-like component DhaM